MVVGTEAAIYFKLGKFEVINLLAPQDWHEAPIQMK